VEKVEHIAVTGLLKATPHTEGENRFVFIEASNEARDVQNEIVLAKALKASVPYYLRYGNLDLDHITQIGMRAGIKDYHFFEIGIPVDVNVDGKRTFVKGSVYRGEGRSAERAEDFWKSLTAQTPAQRWWPSIGGAVLPGGREEGANGKPAVVSKVRWVNTGFSKTPVNNEVPLVTTIPIGAFAKAWDGTGLDLRKALSAGYGTNSAGLEGGGALREQSLEGSPLNYWSFREKIAGDLRGSRIKQPTAKSILDWAVKTYGLGQSLAAEWVDRFMADVSHHQQQRTAS
jgi:hypothetical protein